MLDEILIFKLRLALVLFRLQAIFVVVFVEALYRCRSVIRHAIDNTKIQPDPKIEQYDCHVV